MRENVPHEKGISTIAVSPPTSQNRRLHRVVAIASRVAFSKIGVMTDRAVLHASGAEAWRVGALTTAVVAAVYFGTGVFDHDIWFPTEPTVSGVVSNMVRHSSFAVPRINEFPYLEKPPLSYWLSWLTCQANGKLTAACLRFPSAVFGVISLALLYWIARRRNGAAVACVTVLFAATSIEFYQFSHRAGADILVVFFVFLCFALFSVTLLQTGGSRLGTVVYDMGFAAALAMSFYAKNFFTFLVVLPSVLLFLFYKREFGRMFRTVALVAIFTALAVLPWALALHREGGWEYLRVVFLDNTLGRFFNFANPGQFRPGPLNDAFTVERNTSPFLYLGTLLWVPAPWSLVFLASLISLFGQRDANDFRFFLKLAIVVVPLALTLSASRTPEYLVPLLFITMLIVGELLRDLFSDPENVSRLERGLFLTNVVLIASALVIAPVVLGFFSNNLPAFFVLTPLIVLAFAYFARRVWSDWLAWRSVYGFTCLAALAMLATIMVFFPILDAKRSYAPFFKQVRLQSRDRELYTTLLDDKLLPLMEFYLDRRVPIIRDDEKLFQLLKSNVKVGVILESRSYQRLKKSFDLIPHQLITPPSDIQRLVLVNSP
jgi:4-amino-4-deoxy-L-arabinose transferase-like glycosyltransferase